jgi:hypothetical protein
MPSAVTKTIAGFIAGFLAVAIFHQGMYVILQQTGVPLGGKPWNLTPYAGAFNMPTVINQCFWGGLWGIVYAFLVDRIPGGQGWLKGFIFGFVFPMLIGSWLVVALIKGTPVFSGAFAKGFDGMRLVPGFFLNGVAFGTGLGLLYPLIAGLIPGEARASARG